MVQKKKKTKKDLKQKVKKKLDKLKKKMPKKDFKKIAKKVMSKVDRTKGSQAIGNILDRLRQTVPPPPQIVQDPRLVATQLKDRLEKETKVEFSKPIKDFKNMKKAYDKVLEKYKSGNLDPVDLFVLYTATRQFATTANDYIPSQEEIGSAYRTVKSKINYFKDWINRNRPSGQSQVQDIPTRTQPPPTPPTPPPTQAPTPSPPPTQAPTPPPTLQNIYDSIPSISPHALTVGVGVLATGGILGRLSQANQRIIRNQQNIESLGRGVGNQLAENIAEQSLGQVIDTDFSQTIANMNSNLNEIESIFNEVASSNKETLNNRQIRQGSVPPLRQRTRDTRLRSAIGEKQRQSKFADKTIPKSKFVFKEEVIEKGTRPSQQEQDKQEERFAMEDQLGSMLPPEIEPDFETMKINLESFDEEEAEKYGGLSDSNIQRLVDKEKSLRQTVDKFQNQIEDIPDLPNVPQEQIQTRTEEDIMEGLLN